MQLKMQLKMPHVSVLLTPHPCGSSRESSMESAAAEGGVEGDQIDCRLLND